MTSIAQINEWAHKYPFDEKELEIILRCHHSIVDNVKDDKKRSFLSTLAHAFPYVFFFLPKDEVENRINLIEEYILPHGFGERLEETLFPFYSAFGRGFTQNSETENKSIESLIKSMAKCCKGDANETLGTIFDCCCDSNGTVQAETIIQLCYQLSVAATILVAPKIDVKRIKNFPSELTHPVGLTNSLTHMVQDAAVTKFLFVSWGLHCAPHIGSTLSAFIYNLVFHGKSKHSKLSPFSFPTIYDSSAIFSDSESWVLFAISCMSPDLGGEWHRLFSSSKAGGSSLELEKSINEHVGPSIFVVKTESGRLLGGCAESGWKFGYFLFEIKPYSRIRRSLGTTGKYFLKHHITIHNEHGVEVKGTGFYPDDGASLPPGVTLSPQLFLSDDLKMCKSVHLDLPFPDKVEAFELWGIHG